MAAGENANSVVGTIGGASFVDRLLAECPRCDAIVHAAACINFDPLCSDVILVNCLGTQQILSIAETWSVRRLVYLSSVPVIGRPEEHPITERHPTSPRTTYHATKLFGEHLLAAASAPGTAYVSLRLTAPVGAGMPDARILPQFVRSALRDQPLSVHGRGTRRQNYVDVRDVAAAIAQCVELGPRGVFIVGGPSAISNWELAEACVRVVRSRSAIESTGQPDPADDEIWDVTCDAALRAWGYQPQHDIESSIVAVAQEMKQRSGPGSA
jgi:nucleoside-diphosphate-sugar epimerase